MTDLRAELDRVARGGSFDDLERSLRVAAVIAAAVGHLGIVPVVVGGTAVRLWTGAPEFATWDIDLVMDDPPAVEQILRDLGFAPAADGRHWHLSDSAVFIELPARRLEPEDASVTEVDLGDGRKASVLSHVDVLVTRAEELTITPNEEVVRQVLTLMGGIERKELLARARQVDRTGSVAGILDRLGPVADQVGRGAELPSWDELYDLVKGI